MSPRVGLRTSPGPRGVFAALLVASLAASTPAAAQYKAPRTSFGDPDLQGLWTNASITTLERPALPGAGGQRR